MENQSKIAYFSMEIAVDSAMPTYSGGLGVLAGDSLRAAADFRVPMVGVTLVHRKGYFHQTIDSTGWQTEAPENWDIEQFLVREQARASVIIQGRTVNLCVWRHNIVGISGYSVPIYFIDSDLPGNAEWDRHLTDYLYGGDDFYRLCQEVILGIGGIRILRALGYKSIERYHMNEGHPAFITMELLDERVAQTGAKIISGNDIEAVRKKCVFTTHTPVPAGHDKFSMEMVGSVIGKHEVLEMQDLFSFEGVLNMIYLALNMSHYVNGVAKKHGEVSQLMYAPYTIDSITNGVHAAFWTSKPFGELFDQYIPGWRGDNFSLRYALSIPDDEFWIAHTKAKREFIDRVKVEAGIELAPDILTIGFARRAATYKRADLLFHDVPRLKRICSKKGRIQVIYAGKAHPKDMPGKEMIKRIFQSKEALQDGIKIVYLQNYNMELAKSFISGVDLWLNTPLPPLEASGTSGMKAAINGIPSLSILDGWWIEGCIEGKTGWAIGTDGIAGKAITDRKNDASFLYDKLENVILPMFYRNRAAFINIMKHCIALNGSFFNTHRMIQQYILKAYFE